jgi:hypothetical protein
MTPDSVETIKTLWIALGVLLASNIGTIIKIVIDHRYKSQAKDDSYNEHILKTLDKIETDLQRIFTAVKILSGKKWDNISKIIQEEVPKNGR